MSVGSGEWGRRRTTPGYFAFARTCGGLTMKGEDDDFLCALDCEIQQRRRLRRITDASCLYVQKRSHDKDTHNAL
jgi:inorganic pyrophosphatase